MAALPGVRALLTLHRSVTLRHSFGLIPVQLTSTNLPRRLCSDPTKSSEPKPPMNTENESLLDNLNLMGVDLKLVRLRQPGVLRRLSTNERGVAHFLQSKGASRKVVAGIITRFPRAITRSVAHLERRWDLWRNIFKTDAEIVSILDRSPESFFRSSDNENLEKNIDYLTSLGLSTRDLHRLLTTAPRTFSNSLELNKQMVEFLEDICIGLGGKNPELFPKVVISRNLYILIQSTKRIKTNIDMLSDIFKLSDSELLTLLHGRGAEILDLSSECMKKCFNSLQEKMVSLGCEQADAKKLVLSYPKILYIMPETLSTKLDCLLQGGITMKQILEKPKVLEYSTQNITGRLEKLQRVGYDFETNGIHILDTSGKRFAAKLEKLEKNHWNKLSVV